MKLLKLAVLGLFLVGALAVEAPAQFGKSKFKNKNKNTTPAATVFTDPLETADLVAKLKLSAGQKGDVDKLFKEFDTKLKEIASKATAEPATGNAKFKNKGGKGGAATASPAVTAAIELREKYEEKFEAILTEPQKKTLEDIRVKQGEALLQGKK